MADRPKNSGKAPSFQFYYKDWLSDHRLKRASKRAKGVWIDLIAISCDLIEKGVFRDELGPFDRNEMLDLLTGNRRENASGFDELIKRQIIKQRNDGTFYVKRIYEDAKLSTIRKEAGKKGGNPNLVKNLVNQKLNQQANQNPTPSFSSSSSTSFTNNNTNIPTHHRGADGGLDWIVLGGKKYNFLDNEFIIYRQKDIELMSGFIDRFQPMNGSLTVLRDIAAVISMKAIQSNSVTIYESALQHAFRIVDDEAINNPIGAFVSFCKEHYGYMPRRKEDQL